MGGLRVSVLHTRWGPSTGEGGSHTPPPHTPMPLTQTKTNHPINQIIPTQQAIDPEYYKSLCQILEFPLEDLGLDLTFACEASEFGVVKVRSSGGREEKKEKMDVDCMLLFLGRGVWWAGGEWSGSLTFACEASEFGAVKVGDVTNGIMGFGRLYVFVCSIEGGLHHHHHNLHYSRHGTHTTPGHPPTKMTNDKCITWLTAHTHHPPTHI